MVFSAPEYVEVLGEDSRRAPEHEEDRRPVFRYWQAALVSSGLLGAAALLATAVSAPQHTRASAQQPFLRLNAELADAAHPEGKLILLPPPTDSPEPAAVAEPAAQEATAAAPAAPAAGKCATEAENCWDSRCCVDENTKCYMKDEDWAGCMPECTPGVHATDPAFAQTPWKCYLVPKEGPAIPPPAAPAPAPGEYPSLFCFEIIRTDTYELGVVKRQRELKASIFGCEAFVVFADNAVDLGGGINTVELGDLTTGNGIRTHFANTDIFTRAFDLLRDKGDVMQHDWLVKVDPDAVFLPVALKQRINIAAPDSAGNMYFQNCFFQDKNWMFGAIEVLSIGALNAYYGGRDSQCRGGLDYDNMGEDTFLARCLDMLGVEARQDYELLSDGYCSEAPGDCRSNQVTYHPFKDPESWEVCFKAATETLR